MSWPGFDEFDRRVGDVLDEPMVEIPLARAQEMRDEIGRLTIERELWRKLAEARAGILTAYRVGGRPPGKHIDAAREAESRLRQLDGS